VKNDENEVCFMRIASSAFLAAVLALLAATAGAAIPVVVPPDASRWSRKRRRDRK
jgi:hypothetical protein